MKVFNGKKAAEDYMSAHTLAFSTPELTLTRFAFWLGDIIPDPTDKDSTMPRLYSYVDEKDFAPANIIDDDTYVPSGAVRQSSAYGSTRSTAEGESRFCGECGIKISSTAKFCTECGTTQD